MRPTTAAIATRARVEVAPRLDRSDELATGKRRVVKGSGATAPGMRRFPRKEEQ
jgi:hypothetical protein